MGVGFAGCATGSAGFTVSTVSTGFVVSAGWVGCDSATIGCTGAGFSTAGSSLTGSSLAATSGLGSSLGAAVLSCDGDL